MHGSWTKSIMTNPPITVWLQKRTTETWEQPNGASIKGGHRDRDVLMSSAAQGSASKRPPLAMCHDGIPERTADLRSGWLWPLWPKPEWLAVKGETESWVGTSITRTGVKFNAVGYGAFSRRHAALLRMRLPVAVRSASKCFRRYSSKR